MSKKKKKKKFKVKLAQALSNIESKNDSTQKTIYEKPKLHEEIKNNGSFSNIRYIKKDIKQIVLAISICVILLLVISFFNQKTDYIKNFSEKLTNSLNIEI